MASNEYLDEEYFQIQDFLSVLSDTLPKLELDKLTVNIITSLPYF